MQCLNIGILWQLLKTTHLSYDSKASLNSNRYLLFLMGKVSILLIACLAIERWLCIFKPMKYQKHFSKKRVIIYVAAMFVATCILSINKFFLRIVSVT